MKTPSRITLSPQALQHLAIAELERRGLTVTASVVRTDGSIILDYTTTEQHHSSTSGLVEAMAQVARAFLDGFGREAA